MNLKKFSIIAALCENYGIGHSNKLAWKLKTEMQYFTRITSRTNDAEKKNVVIMGNKTWNSIPVKFRPLPDRINIVLSRSLKEKPKQADYLFNSLEDALDFASSLDEVEKIFVIGGAEVYKAAIELSDCDKLYLTKVHQLFDCDTFFPSFDPNIYKEIKQDDVPQEMQQENGIKFSYHVYQRTNHEPSQVSSNSSLPLSA